MANHRWRILTGDGSAGYVFHNLVKLAASFPLVYVVMDGWFLSSLWLIPAEATM
jgi:hypothetical protein